MTRRVNPPKLGPKPEDLDWGLSKEAGGARRGCWGDATERQTPRRSCWSDEIPQASVQTMQPAIGMPGSCYGELHLHVEVRFLCRPVGLSHDLWGQVETSGCVMKKVSDM